MNPSMTKQIAKKGKLIVVSGPSGVGKGTLIRELFRRGGFPLVPSVSATTRPMRPGEQNGVDYFFLTRGEFLRKREAGAFLESFEVYPGGDLYGTPAEAVETALDRGDWVLLEIDVKGGTEVLKTHPNALTIFILPPNHDALRERLVGRGSETEASLAKRLAQAAAEIEGGKDYRFHVVNDRLDRAVEELSAILKNNE